MSRTLAVTVYTTERCSRCANAKLLLDRRGIAYEEVDLAKDPDRRAQLQQMTGMTTFPQIVIGDQALGGYDDLVAADRAGELAALPARRASTGDEQLEVLGGELNARVKAGLPVESERQTATA